MKMLSQQISTIYTLILLLLLQASLEAKKPKKGLCPIGFKTAYMKDSDYGICYRLKGPEVFNDTFKDCSGNLYTAKLFNKLNISNYTEQVIWTEYKSAYPGGPFIDSSFTSSVGSLLENSFDVSNQQTGYEEELCIVKQPAGNYTAVSCDQQYYRYCVIDMSSDDSNSTEGCDILDNSRRFWSPKPMCLIALIAVRGSAVRATWIQAKDLCEQRGGEILYSGWRYSNSPQMHISEPLVFPLRVTYSQNKTIIRNGVGFVRHPTDVKNTTDEVLYGALNNTKWAMVNSSYVFYNVICEKDVELEKVALTIKVDDRNKLVLTVNYNINESDIYCFTDSKTYYPTPVKITNENPQSYVLKPENDGYYWCVSVDSKHYKSSTSDKVLWIRESQSVKNTYAVKLYFRKEYSFKNVDDVSEIWEKKLTDYIYYSTEFYKLYGDIDRIEDPKLFEKTLKDFKKSHPELSPKGKDIIYSMKVKRLNLNRRTALVHFQLNPTMNPVQVGWWNDLRVFYMKPVYFCTLAGQQFVGRIYKDCAVHNCVGDFINGVQVVTQRDQGCQNSSTNMVLRSAEVTVSMPTAFTVVPNQDNNNHEVARDGSLSSEEEIDDSSPVDTNTTHRPRPPKPPSTPCETEPATETTTEFTTADTTVSTTIETFPDLRAIDALVRAESVKSEDNIDATQSIEESSTYNLITDRSYPIRTTPEVIHELETSPVSAKAEPLLAALPSFSTTIDYTTWESPTDERPTLELRAMEKLIRNENNSSEENIDIEASSEHIITTTTLIPSVTIVPEVEPTTTMSSLDTVITAVPSFPTTPIDTTTVNPTDSTEVPPEEQLQQVLDELQQIVNNTTVVSIDVIAEPFDNVDHLLSENASLEIPSQLLHLLDQIGAVLYLNGSGEVQTIRDNVALLVATSEPGMPVNGLRIAAGNSNTFAEGDFEIIRDEVNSSHLLSNANEAVVQLPRSVADSSRQISFVVFRNDRAFQTNSTLMAVNSRVLSINVPNVTHFGEDETINIHFSPLRGDPHRNQSRACAYWHFDEHESGFWSQEGCTFIPATAEGMLDTCQCTHLTHFAEILISRELFSELDEKILEYISVIGCCLSIFGLTIIGITAALFRSWRKDFNNKIWLQLCVSIILLVTCFLIVVFAKFNTYNIGCVLIGILLHYSVLASFCWMLVAAVISYRRLVMVFTRDASHKLLKAAAFAWGAPVAVIGILLSANPSAYHRHFEYKSPTATFCYPSGLGMWLSIYAPIAVMLFANWTLFVLIVRSVFASRSIQRFGDSKEAVRCASVSCLLVFLFGLPWIFGIFAYNVVAAYFFALTATFQGFVLFLFFVVGNKKTRDLWLNKLKIKQTRKVPVTSSTYTNRSTGGVGWRGGASSTADAKVSKPRSLASPDDSRFS